MFFLSLVKQWLLAKYLPPKKLAFSRAYISINSQNWHHLHKSEYLTPTFVSLKPHFCNKTQQIEKDRQFCLSFCDYTCALQKVPNYPNNFIEFISSVLSRIKSIFIYLLDYIKVYKLVILVRSGQNGPVNICNFDGANKRVSGQVNHHKHHNDGNGTQNLVVRGCVFVDEFVNNPTNQRAKRVCYKVDCAKATNQTD